MMEANKNSTNPARRSTVSNISQAEQSRSQVSQPNIAERRRIAISVDEAYDCISNSASNVAQIFECSVEVTFLLLQRVKWNEERLVAMLLTEKQGVTQKFWYGSLQSLRNEENCHTCMVCEEPQSMFVMLGCNHNACFSCSKRLLEVRLMEWTTTITCMQQGCPVLYLHTMMENILKQSTFYLERMKTIVVSRWLEQNQKALQCGSSGCHTVLLRGEDDGPIVQCPNCEERFCFICKRRAHQPMTCQQMKLWLNMHTGSSKSLKWLKEHTKSCPQCLLIIEREGGCNHMICPIAANGCGTHFCYVCGDKWNQTHKSSFYTCPNPPPIPETQTVQEQADNRTVRRFDKYERFQENLKKLSYKGRLSDTAKMFYLCEEDRLELMGWRKLLTNTACLLKNSFPFTLLLKGHANRVSQFTDLHDQLRGLFTRVYKLLARNMEDLRWKYATHTQEEPEADTVRKTQIRQLFLALQGQLRDSCRELLVMTTRMQQLGHQLQLLCDL